MANVLAVAGPNRGRLYDFGFIICVSASFGGSGSPADRIGVSVGSTVLSP